MKEGLLDLPPRRKKCNYRTQNSLTGGINNSIRDTVNATGEPTVGEKNRRVAKREGGSYITTRT